MQFNDKVTDFNGLDAIFYFAIIQVGINYNYYN